MDAAGWDTRYAESSHVWSLTPNVFVVEHTEVLAPGRALDLAAGEGRNAIWLAERGWAVTAVDFSEVGLEKGRQRDHTQAVTWVQADATEWVPPPAGFDLVLLCYLHLPAQERRAVHQRAADAVAEGGVLLVVGHDLENLTAGHGGPQDAEVLFDANDVIADLDGSGLRIVTAGQRRRQVEEHPGRSEPEPGAESGSGTGPAEAIDVVVRAERPRSA